MPEENTPPAVVNAPAAEPPATPNAPAAEGSTVSTEPMSVEEATKLRRELNSVHKRLKDFEAKEAAEADAKRTDLEKAAKRAEEAETRTKEYQQRYVSAEVKLLAQSLGFANPATAYKLIRDELTYDDKTGDATNAEDLLKKLLKDEPYLAAQQGQQQGKAPLSSGGATNPPRTSGTRVTKADIEAHRVPRDELKRLWDSGEMLKILAEP